QFFPETPNSEHFHPPQRSPDNFVLSAYDPLPDSKAVPPFLLLLEANHPCFDSDPRYSIPHSHLSEEGRHNFFALLPTTPYLPGNPFSTSKSTIPTLIFLSNHQ